MHDYIVGDLLTGRRIQSLRPLAGSWSEELNGAGALSCTVSLRNDAMKRLGLLETAIPGKSFLAVVDGDTVLQAGPIWAHDWNEDTGRLDLIAAGMWSYFDHRTLLPVLAGRLPSDPTTDTDYTGKSLQGVARGLVAQAQSWTSGDVPVNLPTEVAGTSDRSYKGADVAPVGDRLHELTGVINGPEIRFSPRWSSDRLGVEWDMEIGTPSEPKLFSAQRPVFYVGTDKSSVTNLRVGVNGSRIGSQAFALGGRTDDQSLVSVSTDPTLTGAGFPLLELVDSTHSTVSEVGTLQGYSDELVARSKRPVQTWSFTHNLSTAPFLSSFRAGDFATVRVVDSHYLAVREYTLRILTRSGTVKSDTVDLTFEPEQI